LVTAIKAIKHLSTSPQLIEILQNSNAMEILVGILGKSIKGAHANVSRIMAVLCGGLDDTGDLFAHIPDCVQYDQTLKSSTRGSSFQRYYTST